MPGAPNMPVFANLASPHVGALENAKTFVELAEKDSKAGFVTFGHEFPDVWPCNIDPMNVVIQGEKGRLTIDKSILSSGDPELPSFNLSINLEVDEEGKRYRLVRHWQFSRAAAILDTACVGLSGIQLKLAKLDWESYFRKHGKQRAHVHQSGRLLADGYGTDWRVNFGESNAPDHTGRSSNAVLFFIRRELARLEAAYPTRHPQLRAWLRYRLEVLEASAAPVEEFCGAMPFFVMAYVDDLGFAIVDDFEFIDAVWEVHNMLRVDPIADGVNPALVPLFRVAGTREPLRSDFIRDETKRLMRAIGEDPTVFNTHSYRIGGATALFAAGADMTVIKTMGRWASDIYQLYVRACMERCCHWTRLAGSTRVTDVAKTIDEVDDY